MASMSKRVNSQYRRALSELFCCICFSPFPCYFLIESNEISDLFLFRVKNE